MACNIKDIEVFSKKCIIGLTTPVIIVIFVISIRERGSYMPTTIYLRDFPENLQRKVKAEAALMGISMKELIIRALTEYLKKKKGG